jgi:hypothetical protein
MHIMLSSLEKMLIFISCFEYLLGFNSYSYNK